MSDPIPPPAQSGSFPVADLEFSFAWSAVAPGIDGWRVELVQIASGEMLDVTPPGAEYPVFSILPRFGHVEVIRERPLDFGGGGGQVPVGRFPSLREAVLALCPLHKDEIAKIDRELSRPSVIVPTSDYASRPT